MSAPSIGVAARSALLIANKKAPQPQLTSATLLGVTELLCSRCHDWIAFFVTRLANHAGVKTAPRSFADARDSSRRSCVPRKSVIGKERLPMPSIILANVRSSAESSTFIASDSSDLNSRGSLLMHSPTDRPMCLPMAMRLPTTITARSASSLGLDVLSIVGRSEFRWSILFGS